MNSRVHPKYKTKYGVSNWADYDHALVLRLVFNLPLRQAKGFLSIIGDRGPKSRFRIADSCTNATSWARTQSTVQATLLYR